MRKFLTIGVVLLSMLAEGQIETDADFRRTVYREEFSVGLILHTRSPWPGVNFRRLSYSDGYNKWGYEIDYTSYRHPREIKYPVQSILGNSRSFTFGKINDFFALRGGYGRERILFDKTDQGSVSISLQTYGGVALGFLKPIYVEVRKVSGDGTYIDVVERYNPDEHDNVYVYGEDSFFTGFNETQMRLGVYGKVGVSFDYNFLDQRITSMEVGAIFDYYPSWFGLYEPGGVPVMAETDNLALWWQLYVSFNFGNKWF
ncbi:hypothetical protein [Phaeocystidibacter marisrubri]|uniref:Outer membrane protein beta-barrel domain-containing protein n=1 Tax=Phaeocystidibacter marisrubri TaxID=1577780 RepID=A0A6L3ZI11_9FLAO|nr:hypothetical protein [Phaeocystidibacter marisrubri]KAB2817263.1 hypothetical protein F8C82_02405 [Phaeocystidibacter marisrubri]GGH76190.1 hypothetical protein GCM10011318_24080 [Phaeocystidibacter marisrubri]